MGNDYSSDSRRTSSNRSSSKKSSSRREVEKYEKYPNNYQINKYLGEPEHDALQVIRNYCKYDRYDVKYVARQYGRILCEKGGTKGGAAIGAAIGGTFGHFIGAAVGVLLGGIIGW
eukprot:CAMPEP_0201564320 /NCGR_PEP_ID=MMETSP0190_2-20130828/2515_1 /ASSEMBLY_ACC=CAM_ASM_000263 /TAXON_ID=37353 /ORGANISM="Rosalina sp." /LENGTH=115 /DNA_ID=CAMNT_0047980343 /DNA_START=44 /DNA_END=388 /DNA_ORIENTATION=-